MQRLRGQHGSVVFRNRRQKEVGDEGGGWCYLILERRGGGQGRVGRVTDWALSAAWEATGCFKHRSDITKCIHSFHTYSQRTHSVQSNVLGSGAGRAGEGSRIW